MTDSWASGSLRRFPGYSDLSDFPGSFIVVLLLADSRRGPRQRSGQTVGSPGFREGASRAPKRAAWTTAPVRCVGTYAGVLDHAESVRISRWRPGRCCLPCDMKPSALRTITFSRLNTQSIPSPVNASATASRPTPHDSGPVWLATPSLCDSFIHYTSPALAGAPCPVCRRVKVVCGTSVFGAPRS